MILYVPGRMPTQQISRYPGSSPIYYSSAGLLSHHHGYSTSPPASAINSSYYGSLSLHQVPLDLPVWPRRMPAEEELVAIGSPNAALANLAGSPNGAPPSPVHSDSDASNSSLELGSVGGGENAQLKCK